MAERILNLSSLVFITHAYYRTGFFNVTQQHTESECTTLFVLRNLLKLFNEIHYWDRLQFEIPHFVTEVYQRREELHNLRENVLLVVRDYNRLVCLTESDFSDLWIVFPCSELWIFCHNLLELFLLCCLLLYECIHLCIKNKNELLQVTCEYNCFPIF